MENLIRDKYSIAVINTDTEGFLIHKNEQKRARELLRLKSDVNKLSTDVSEMKQMLQQILDGMKKNG